MHDAKSLASLCIFGLRHRRVARVIRKVADEHLSYHDIDSLLKLARVAINNEKNHIEGAIIETGCGSGGSAITLAAAKSKDRMLLVYDVFGFHPPPSEENGPDVHERYKIIASGKAEGIAGKTYYGYERDLYGKVLQTFADFGLGTKENNVHLTKGLFENTLKVESPVSLAHIDCDWYESVMICLNRIEPHLVKGGTIVVNEYWSGSRKAIGKYFENKSRDAYSFTARDYALMIVKK
jgi:asparagine synthase (glutamine-hydrolysing)